MKEVNQCGGFGELDGRDQHQIVGTDVEDGLFNRSI
jgi:hypothetical protein